MRNHISTLALSRERLRTAAPIMRASSTRVMSLEIGRRNQSIANMTSSATYAGSSSGSPTWKQRAANAAGTRTKGAV